MEYYSRRNNAEPISTAELHLRISALVEEYIIKDFFKDRLGITETSRNFDSVNRKSLAQIGIHVFPLKSWLLSQIEKIEYSIRYNFFFNLFLNHVDGNKKLVKLISSIMTTQPIIQEMGRNYS
jgi:hypothetical protein